MRDKPLAKGQKASRAKGEPKPTKGIQPDKKYYDRRLPFDHEKDPKVIAYLKASGLIP